MRSPRKLLLIFRIANKILPPDMQVLLNNDNVVLLDNDGSTLIG